MSKHCKCKKSGECEECPEWIFTFADLVMLMMGFFVILWVLKPAPGKSGSGADQQAVDEKWLETVAKIREAFGRLPDPTSSDPVDMHMLMKKIEGLEPAYKGRGKGGETTTPKQGARGTDPLVTIVRPGNHVTEGTRMVFAPGESALTPESTRILDEIARLIKGHRNIVQVKGHTSLDDLPEGATRQQLMDLSIRRAQAAADYLIAHDVAPEILRVQGCSTFEPVVQREYAPDSQAMNRRVEIEATDLLVQEQQDQSKPSAAPLVPPLDRSRPVTTGSGE
jgi:chemotaxis protein MotB